MPMRTVFALVMVGLASAASAQPAPSAASPAPVPADDTSFEVRAGLGFGRYSEHMFGFDFSSDIQPFALLAIEGEFPAGRGFVVVQADAGLGTEVDMHATSQGMLVQNNRFRQELYDGSLRYRGRGTGRLIFEIGYRFTMQRLHFSDIRDQDGNMTLIDAATEVVNVHALEGGLGWRHIGEDGTRRQLLFVIGLNRATAENDQIEDEDFSAIGASLNVRATHRWASGFQLEGQLAFRQQGGSDPEQVTVMGMQTDGVWPNNTTWHLLAVAGYAF